MLAERLTTKDFNLWIGKHHILKDVNLELRRRGVTCIIGPSGCGKSTLLKSFSRLVDLVDGVRTSGEIFVDGQNILDAGVDVTALRKKMGLLSQKPTPLPMSIFGNVAYGLKMHYRLGKREQAERVHYYLDAVGLWPEVKDRLREPAAALSLGQQQRLCLARGLAVEPEVILCDEPTSALDPASSKKVEALLVQLAGDYTIILVTHVLRQARKIADHVHFIYLGELVESGPAAEVLNNPREELTREYLYGDVGY
jgi:phosphate transport system ATP-binding protein